MFRVPMWHEPAKCAESMILFLFPVVQFRKKNQVLFFYWQAKTDDNEVNFNHNTNISVTNVENHCVIVTVS